MVGLFLILDASHIYVPKGYISPLKWDIDIKKFFDKFGTKMKHSKLNHEVFNEKHLYSGEIDFVGEFFDVREHIIYIKAKEIEGVKKLKEHFRVG